MTAFENNLRMQPRTIARGESIFAEAVTVAEEQERLGAKVFQGKSVEFRQTISFGECREERLGEKWKCFELVTADG